MISIKNDYKGFYKRFSSFLNDIDNEFTFDILSSDEVVMYNTSTPFACNPTISYSSVYLIVYNTTLIEKCHFTLEEEYACIMHEIAHHIYKDYCEKDIEEMCDDIAISFGLSLSMASALCKMKDNLGISSLDERILHSISQIKLYRPEWTSGRYNEKHNVALYYNLIEGMSFLFKGASAKVVSLFLNNERLQEMSLKSVVNATEIDVLCLINFIIELLELGLITNRHLTAEEIDSYRKECIERKHSYTNDVSDSSTVEFDDAELEFTNITGGITSVMFELTYRCSERCIHCYNIGSAHDDSEVSTRHERIELGIEQYKNIIDQLYEAGMFRACLTGGDPFSHKYIWDIIDYLYTKGIAFDIYTNGQKLYGQEKRLSKFYPKIVGVSIYSAVPEVHDKITRVKGSLEKSLAVMRNLAELSIPLYLKCCVIKQNFESYKSVYELADSIPAFPQIEINVTDSVEGNKYVSKYLRLSEEQYDKILEDERIPLHISPKGTMQTIIPRDSSKNLCKAGIHTFNVTPEGYLTPCCRLHIKVGDLKKESLKSMMANSKPLHDWLVLTLQDYTQCGKEDYCKFCNVCPGLNYSEHGIPTEPAENACFLAKIRFNKATKLGII